MTRLLLGALLLVAACGGRGDGEHAGHVMPDAGADPHAGHAGTASDEHAAHGAVPEGYAEVQLAADRIQLIGLRTARVELGAMGGAIRATAMIQADEKRMAHVHSKLMGWIEDLYVNAVGQTVKKGQPLYSIYSQELLVAQQEYLRALGFNQDLAAAARDRLRLWDIPEDQIAEIERRKQPLHAVVVRAPIAGTVLEKSVVKGHYVEPDMMLYLIADLSRVWIVAEVYEYELGRLDRAGEARIRIEGQADTFTGTIDYVYPTVDTATRTVKVRLVVPNPRGLLRPGNFATVVLPAKASEALWVPEEAIIDTGVRQVAYVALGGGTFRPVAVHVGRRAEGKVEVLHGLAPGDEVVVSAQFLLDSESRLRGAVGPGPGHGGH